ncbi:MAG TPA: hypothetical protein VGN77_07455 [Steroidobacteraceae bacterium]|nr:hypothetical protein [Steroidobacteraceae bacterium]
MMMQKNRTFAFMAVAAALLLGACANQMEPAKQAIAGIESAIAAVPDASKYIPEQLAGVQAKLADLKTAYDNKDYKTVMSGAPAVLSEAQGLMGAAMLKKEAMVKAASAEWPTLAAALPALMTTVTNRVTALGKSKHVPAGVDMAAAKSAADEAAASWTKAQAANTAGDLEGAVASAHDAKAKLEAAAAAMKMTLPAAPAAK